MNGSRFSSVDLAMLGVVLIWGANVTITKVVLSAVDPLAFTLGRFLIIAGISVVALGLQSRPLRLREKPWGRLLLLGLIGQAVYQYFFAVGLSRTSTFHGALIVSSSPLFIALLASLFRQERLAPLSWGGVVVAFVGLAFFLQTGNAGDLYRATVVGDLLLLAGTICWATYTLLSKPLLKDLTPLELTAYAILTGLPFMAAYTLPSFLRQDWHLTPGIWAGLAYTAIFPIFVAYLIWAWGIEKIGAVRTSVYSYLVPLVTATVSWFSIGERISGVQVLCAGVVLAGMGLTRLPRART